MSSHTHGGTAIPKSVVLASGNPGKLRELRQMLAPLGWELLPQSQFDAGEVPETGLTFVENAIIKARHAARISGLPAIADDSGLAVDALQGAPGIYSARYAGEGARDDENVSKLLHKLGGVPPSARTARFHCLTVFLTHSGDPTPVICEGVWEGRILLEPRGDNGFGYDPVFFVPEQGCSAAELASEMKNAMSHRGKAVRQLLAAIAQRYQGPD